MIGAGTPAARLLALLLLAGLGAGIWAGPVAVYLDARAVSRARVEQAEALVARYRALAVAPAAAFAAPGGGGQGLLLDDLPAAQVFAVLSERIKAAADGAGLSLQGLQSLGEEQVAGLQRTGLRLRGTGDLAGLARFLDAVEGARPMLLVDGVRIQARQGAAVEAQPALDIQMDVHGFRGPT